MATTLEIARAIVGIRADRFRALNLGLKVSQTRQEVARVHLQVIAAQQNGQLEVLGDSDGIGAVLLVEREALCWPGFPQTRWHLAAHKTPQAKQWLASMIERHRHLIDSNLVSFLSMDDAYLLPQLRSLGAFVDFKVSYGDVRTGLRSVEAAAQLSDLGIEVVQPPDARPALALLRDAITSVASFRWFREHQNELFALKAPALSSMAAEGRILYLKSDGEISGYVGVAEQQAPVVGRVAALEFVLAEKLRGRGLTRSCYRMALAEVARMGISHYFGATHHPAMMHLARVLGRVDHHLIVHFGRPHTNWSLQP